MNWKSRYLMASAALMALSATLGGPAHAQQASARAASAVLDEVIVTAQRRSENLQNAPIAVSAVTGTTLERAGITSTTELSRAVPALVISPAAGANPQIYLRGVGTFVANAYAEQAVAVNLDGVYVARPAGASGFYYDLERVEVLKGPQGTLYGRNATGGAVNIIPKAPKLGVLGGELNAEVGSYDLRKVSGAINVPMGEKAAFRVAAQSTQRDGYYDDGYDDDDGYAVRAQLLVAPNDNWKARLSADYFHQGGAGPAQVLNPFVGGDRHAGVSSPTGVAAFLAGLPAAVTANPFARSLLNPVLPKADGFIDDTFTGLIGQIDGDLGFATLTVIPAFREVSEEYLTYIPSRFYVRSRSSQKSLEARLASPGDQALSWVMGGYYFSEDQTANQDYNHGILESITIPALTDETYAVFGQATYKLSTALRVTGGLRYTRETKTQDTLFTTRNFSPVTPPYARVVNDKDWKATTWKAGVDYDLSSRSLLYASASTGFKAGGFYASAGANTFDPEKVTAFTIGSKNRFFENRLQLNAELYDYEYKQQQITHLGPTLTGAPAAPYAPLFFTENVGRSRIRGFEVELQAKVTPRDLITADLQFLDGQYKSFKYQYYSTNGAPPAVGCASADISSTASPAPVGSSKLFAVDCSGQPLINAPRWAGRVGYEHTFGLGEAGSLVAGVDTYVSAKLATSFDYLPIEEQEGYHLSNARLTFAPVSEAWSLTAYVNNIENAAVISQSYQPQAALGNGMVYVAVRPPRTYGLRLNVSF